MEAYIIVYKNKFCKFGSYNTFKVTDKILASSLFMKKSTATNRITRQYYHYLDGNIIPNMDLCVRKVVIQQWVLQ